MRVPDTEAGAEPDLTPAPEPAPEPAPVLIVEPEPEPGYTGEVPVLVPAPELEFKPESVSPTTVVEVLI